MPKYNQAIRSLFARPQAGYQNKGYVHFPQKRRIDFGLQSSPLAARATSFSTKAAATDLRNNTITEYVQEQGHRRNFTQQLAQRAQQEQAL